MINFVSLQDIGKIDFLSRFSHLEFSNESQGKRRFVGPNCSLDHGDTEYLPLSPATPKAAKVVAQREHNLENLRSCVHVCSMCVCVCVCVCVLIG